MVMVDPIETGTDFDPIGPESSPDVNDASFRAWETQFTQGAPIDFAQAIVPAFESLPQWFETAQTTSRIAYQETRDYVATFHSPNAHDFAHVVLLYGKDPAWQLHLVSGYVARMVRAQDGRTSAMHRVMKRSIDILRATANRAIVQTNARITNVNNRVTSVRAEAARNLANRTAALNANIVKASASTLQTANAWALTHIAKPLNDQATKDRATMLQGIAREHDDARSYADVKIAAAVAPIALAIATLQRQMSAVTTEVQTCLEPMCDYAGPNSELGKLLKGLQLAKWLAILAALETIDVKTLERIANDVAGTEGRIGEWVASAILGELEAQ